MKSKKIILATFLCGLASSTYGSDKYTLEDLRLLDKEANYTEIVDHAKDIRPSQRGDEWKTLVQRAVIKTLEQKLASGEGEAYLALDFSDQMLDIMRDSKAFMDLRSQAIIQGSGACYRNSYYASECTDRLSALVKKTPDDRDLAFQAGKLVRLQANSAAAIPFFTMALKGVNDKKQCADEDVVLAITSGVGLPPEQAKEALALGFSTCFEPLKSQLLEDFYASNGYAVTNYCKALTEKKLLSEFQQAFCLDKM